MASPPPAGGPMAAAPFSSPLPAGAPAGAGGVPAGALPVWPEPTNPAAPGSRAGRRETPGDAASPVPALGAFGAPQDGGSGQSTYGAPSAPSTHPPPGASADYQGWARNQRPAGTMYGGRGGAGVGQTTTAVPGGSSLENSGSLTGHILAQGYTDTAPSSRLAKVIVIGLIMLVLLIAVGLLAATAAGDAITQFFDDLIKI